MQQLVIKRRLDVKKQTAAAFLAVIAAVALPQLLHLCGAMAGVGTKLGEILLPMHAPILLVGLLVGPWAGAAAGICAPMLSFALTAMPRASMLPFMMIELGTYGLCAGLLAKTKLPTLFRVLFAQMAGRAVRAVAILCATHLFSATAVPVSVIWESIAVGVVGILLQWVLLPLTVRAVQANA